MNLIKSEKLAFEDKEYEIRVYQVGDGFQVMSFLGGKPANPYVYSVETITDFEFTRKHGYRAYEDLIETAKSDIQQRTWERYQEAIRR